MALIVQHPKAPVSFDPPPFDPREQRVITAEDVRNVLAMRDDICTACGRPRDEHFDTSGCLMLGCDFAMRKQEHMEIPGYDVWKTTAEPEPSQDEDRTDPEAERDERWAEFEDACRQFAKAEGWPAVNHAVGRAMDRQGNFLK